MRRIPVSWYLKIGAAMQAYRRCSSAFQVVRIFLTVIALTVLPAWTITNHVKAQTAASGAQAQFRVGGVSVALLAPRGTGMVELGNDRNFFDPAVPAATGS